MTDGRRQIPDDIAYILPMAAFMIFTALGVEWPDLYAATYLGKTILTAILLIALRRSFTPITWNFWWLGIMVGVIGIVQWVGMEKLLLHYWPHYPRGSHDASNPLDQIASPQLRWAFLAVRLAGPVLVVPFMEELFWRDFLWRSLLAPNNFKLADIGEWDWKAIAIVTIAFASVHAQWITAIVWALMIAILLIRTRSLGACILAHATTNLLLGIYVMATHDWYFW